MLPADDFGKTLIAVELLALTVGVGDVLADAA